MKLYFECDGLKLCGTLTKPESETNKCVILCHGITVDKDEDGIFTKLANDLTEKVLQLLDLISEDMGRVRESLKI